MVIISFVKRRLNLISIFTPSFTLVSKMIDKKDCLSSLVGIYGIYGNGIPFENLSAHFVIEYCDNSVEVEIVS